MERGERVTLETRASMREKSIDQWLRGRRANPVIQRANYQPAMSAGEKHFVSMIRTSSIYAALIIGCGEKGTKNLRVLTCRYYTLDRLQLMHSANSWGILRIGAYGFEYDCEGSSDL